MDSSLRISNYSFLFFEDRTGISIKVTMSDGSTGKLWRNVSRFVIMDGKKCIARIGYTHPDFNKVKSMFAERDAKIKEYRKAVNYGKGKSFII